MLGMLGHGGGAAGSDELLERRHHREECQEPSDDPRYSGYTRLTGRGLPVILIMAILPRIAPPDRKRLWRASCSGWIV
jgi:hypothetical protein